MVAIAWLIRIKLPAVVVVCNPFLCVLFMHDAQEDYLLYRGCYRPSIQYMPHAAIYCVHLAFK